MRISEIYNLDASQYELDFINIDPNDDTPLYISPHYLASREDKWSQDANRTVRSFFQHILDLLVANKLDEAKKIFAMLTEPSETCLGVSSGSTSGAGVGPQYAEDILESIIESDAVESGLIEDLGDTVIFVDGVGRDRMSDMTTNIIRNQLITYTIQQCNNWSIPLTDNIPHGYVWDREKRKWIGKRDKALIADGKRILLVPKAIASRATVFTHRRYFSLPVLDFIQTEIQSRQGDFLTKKEIVDDIKLLEQHVDKNRIINLKDFLREFTKNHPEIFKDFKVESLEEEKPLNTVELTSRVTSESLDAICEYLIQKLDETKAGKKHADRYEKVVAGILELIFYPDLICPDLQTKIENGRKRVDITFENSASSGFFYNLHQISNIPSTYIYLECKNYSSDPTNPELDQLTGRFQFRNGQFGILICRSIDDMDLFINRCADSFSAGRGLVVPLVDEDLINMLLSIKENYNTYEESEKVYETILRERAKRVRLRE